MGVTKWLNPSDIDALAKAGLPNVEGHPLGGLASKKRTSSVPAGGRLVFERAGAAPISLRTAYFAWFANAHQSPIWI